MTTALCSAEVICPSSGRPITVNAAMHDLDAAIDRAFGIATAPDGREIGAIGALSVTRPAPTWRAVGAAWPS